MAKESYKSKVMKLRGWNESEYQAQYDVFKHRVRRYNKVYGTEYSASKLFYEGARYGGRSRAFQDILSTSSATTWKKEEKAELAKESPFQTLRIAQLKNKFAQLLSNSPEASEYIEYLDSVNAPAQEYKDYLYDFSDELHRKQKESGFEIGTY